MQINNIINVRSIFNSVLNIKNRLIDKSYLVKFDNNFKIHIFKFSTANYINTKLQDITE